MRLVQENTLGYFRRCSRDKEAGGQSFHRSRFNTPHKDTLYIAPNDGEKKFYIIKDADYLTPAAQNALLLPIEEPPEFVMFFLLCEDSASLLETVRSRAPVLRTEKFPASFIEEYLSKKYKNADKKKLEYASHLASGSLGRAVELYENGDEEAKLYKCAEELLSLMLSGKSSDGILFIRGKMRRTGRTYAKFSHSCALLCAIL